MINSKLKTSKQNNNKKQQRKLGKLRKSITTLTFKETAGRGDRIGLAQTAHTNLARGSLALLERGSPTSVMSLPREITPLAPLSAAR